MRRNGFATIGPPPVPGIAGISAPVFDHLGQIQMTITVMVPTSMADTSPDGPIVAKLLAFTKLLSSYPGYEDDGSPFPRTGATES